MRVAFKETGQDARVIWTGTGKMLGEEPGPVFFCELQERAGHLPGKPVQALQRHGVAVYGDGNAGFA